MPHEDLEYFLDCGCEIMDHSLGIQKMPEGYHLMLDQDGMYFFWFEIETGRESAIYWDKWAVYKNAKYDKEDRINAA